MMSVIPLSPQNVLDVLLKKTPQDANFKRSAINKIWNTDLGLADFKDEEDAYGAYFRHIYQDLCNAACTGNSQISGFTHEQVLTIVKDLRAGSQSQEQILAKLHILRAQTPQAEAERAVNLAASLLVPLNFSGAGGARRGETVNWETTETLEHVISPKITALLSATETAIKSAPSSCEDCNLSLRFPKSFNARQIKYVAGFEIVWTSNLLDHLLVLDADEQVTVHIYHQVKLLRYHQESLRLVISSSNKFIYGFLILFQLSASPRLDLRNLRHVSFAPPSDQSKRQEVVPEVTKVLYAGPRSLAMRPFEVGRSRDRALQILGRPPLETQTSV
jgi:hypothetical protein